MGLATGSTPLGVYRELIHMHREEVWIFKVVTFNLDEYYGLPPSHPQSYHYFMNENLFKHINIPPERIYIPSGTATDVKAHCAGMRKALKNGVESTCRFWASDVMVILPLTNRYQPFSRTRMKTLTRENHRRQRPLFDKPEDAAVL